MPLSKLTGRTDHLGRPVIRIEAGDESILALVDTGFNGELMMSETDARMLGFTILERTIHVKLAAEQSEEVLQAIGSIDWMGKERRVSVLVTTDCSVLRRDDDPVAMIGTALLTPHLLKIDFASRLVEIETCE